MEMLFVRGDGVILVRLFYFFIFSLPFYFFLPFYSFIDKVVLLFFFFFFFLYKRYCITTIENMRKREGV